MKLVFVIVFAFTTYLSSATRVKVVDHHTQGVQHAIDINNSILFSDNCEGESGEGLEKIYRPYFSALTLSSLNTPSLVFLRSVNIPRDQHQSILYKICVLRL